METTTHEDRLIFFGITFITLSSLTFNINYVLPISGVRWELLYLVPLILSCFITFAKLGIGNISKKQRN